MHMIALCDQRLCCSSVCPSPAVTLQTARRHPQQLAGSWCCSQHSARCNGAFKCSGPALRRNCQRFATADESQGRDVVYSGMYGPWRIEQEDIIEVWTYRLGLSVAVAAFITAAAISSTASSQGAAAETAATWALNPLAALGAGAFGVSLVQIHIYMAPVKRTLQLLWGLGVAGGCYLALTHLDQPLPLLVVQQPWSVWFVGPVAAAATGVAIKEGICYGKPEAAGLAVLLPLLCLSHLSGAAPTEVEQALLLAVCGVAAVFAARKYSQAIKDDIGDKSVFTYLKQQQQQQQIASSGEQGKAE